MNNNWIAEEDTLFAEWVIKLPYPSTIEDVHRLFSFAEDFLQAARSEAIFRVVEDTEDKAGSTFIKSWRLSWAQSSILPLFDRRIRDNWEIMPKASGLICYFDGEHQIRESEIKNMGLLMYEIHKGRDISGYAGAVKPVSIHSDSVHKKDISNNESVGKKLQLKISISLRTDIWFPKVLGLINHDQLYFLEGPKWFDNSKLAACHTPRLNNFLLKAHKLTLDIGGEWILSKPEGIAGLYDSMVGEYAILL